jgi:IPT/TIG domain
VNVTVTTGGATSATSKHSLYAYGPPTVSSFAPASGITGTTVTIKGKNFVPGTKVKFASKTSPKVTFVSTTELKALVPDGAVAGKLSVTTAAGTATSSTSFTPTLSITGLSPTSATVGTSVTIKGVGFNPSSVVKFNGTKAKVTSRSATQLKVTVPKGATSGPVTVTNTTSPTGTVNSAASFSVT